MRLRIFFVILMLPFLLFSRPVVSGSLWPRGLQQARPPYPSPSPEVCSSSCPLHWWCHPTVSSSITLFSFCPQSFLASGTFQMNQPFASGDQNTGASVLASLVPMSIQGWFPLRLTALISTLKSLLQHHSLKLSILWHSAFFTIQLSQPYVTTGKTIALSIQTFVSSVMSLLFNTLSRFVIAFLPRSNHLLILWLQSPSAAILEPKKRKSVGTSTFSPSICQILVFLIFSFFTPLSSSRGSLVPLHFLPLGWYHSLIWGCCFSLPLDSSL